MADPLQQLQCALDALDTLFAPLSGQPFRVDGCTYCYSHADLDALAGPADQVPEELIPLVAAEATDHWGDFPSMYRRMTPRIVRSLAEGKLHVDHGLIATRLNEAGWRNWAAVERQALEKTWDTWWRAVLNEYPAADNVWDVLEMLSVSTGTLAPWLGIWAATRTEAADAHLRDAVDWWLIESELSDLHFGFHGEFHATPELLPWLAGPVHDRLNPEQRSEVRDIQSWPESQLCEHSFR